MKAQMPAYLIQAHLIVRRSRISITHSLTIGLNPSKEKKHKLFFQYVTLKNVPILKSIEQCDQIWQYFATLAKF